MGGWIERLFLGRLGLKLPYSKHLSLSFSLNPFDSVPIPSCQVKHRGVLIRYAEQFLRAAYGDSST